MIAKHLCVHEKYRSFFPKEEHIVTTYFLEYPPSNVLRDGIDSIHYVVIELVPDEMARLDYVKSKIVEV